MTSEKDTKTNYSKLDVGLRTFPAKGYPYGTLALPGRNLPPGSILRDGELNRSWHKLNLAAKREISKDDNEVIIIGTAYQVGPWKRYDLSSGYGLHAVMESDGSITPLLRPARLAERHALRKKVSTPAGSSTMPIDPASYMDGPEIDVWPVLVQLWSEPVLEPVQQEEGIDESIVLTEMSEEDEALLELEEGAPESFDDDDPTEELDFEG